MALKLQINIPLELALTRPDPKRYTNEGRTSLMYSVVLRDGTEEKAFLTQACADTITQLQIQPREWFTLCRRKLPNGGGEYFEVHTSANSVRSGVLASIPTPTPAPVPQPIPAQRASSSHSGASSVMGAALMAAIDAATEAKQYAASKGITLEFKPEDLRAIANTLFIAASKDSLFSERVA